MHPLFIEMEFDAETYAGLEFNCVAQAGLELTAVLLPAS